MTDPASNQYHILYVDDEVKALRYFKQCFEDEFIIHTATNAEEGFHILETYGTRIGILLTDQRMPGESGVELMERARRIHPNLIRILVTAYTDYDSAVKAVNEGRAWRYMHKPLDPEEISQVIEEAFTAYKIQLDRERLLYEKADDLRAQLMAEKVTGMGILAEGLNHHLRNALTVVRAFIDLAPMKLMEEIEGRMPRDPNFWIDTQAHAQAQIERIQSLLTNVAQASHAKKLSRTDEMDLRDLLIETQATYAGHIQEKSLIFDIDIDAFLPHLLVHGERFRQLFRLLFIEEITHLHPGDSFKITATVESDAMGDEYAIITLTDNGAWGSANDSADNLFDPFYTRSRKPDDFGVNMMACYVTLHLHGGNVTAQRLDPEGLALTMRLPLDPEKSTHEAEEFLRRAINQESSWLNEQNLAA